MAKSAFSKRKKLLTKGMSSPVKKTIVKALIVSVALYCVESWSLKEDIRTLEAFDMWIYQKLPIVMLYI